MKKVLLTMLLVSVFAISAQAKTITPTTITNLALNNPVTYTSYATSANAKGALDLQYSIYMFSSNGQFNNGSATTINYIDPEATFTLATTNVREGEIKVFMATSIVTKSITITPAAMGKGSNFVLGATGDTVVLQNKGAKWYIIASDLATDAAQTITALTTTTLVATTGAFSGNISIGNSPNLTTISGIASCNYTVPVTLNGSLYYIPAIK